MPISRTRRSRVSRGRRTASFSSAPAEIGFMEPGMTSAISAPPVTKRPARGFSLLQLLAAMVIVVLLTGMLLTAVVRANRVARRTRIAADLQSIGVALDAY